MPSPHNTAPHGADGRRRGFSISQDMVGSMVAVGESLGYLPEQRTPRPPSLCSRGGKSALARTPRLGPAEGCPRRLACWPAAGTGSLAPATMAPNRLESPSEHPWGRRTAVLPWYEGAPSAPPVKTRRNWAVIRVRDGAGARGGRSTWRRRSFPRVLTITMVTVIPATMCGNRASRQSFRQRTTPGYRLLSRSTPIPVRLSQF